MAGEATNKVLQQFSLMFCRDEHYAISEKPGVAHPRIACRLLIALDASVQLLRLRTPERGLGSRFQALGGRGWALVKTSATRD